MTSRFVGFFRLIEACGHEGCPVCRCLKEDAVRYLDAMLYEQVNDPGTRRALRASWGFCNWHAWQAREIAHSGQGMGIISEDLLSRALGRLRRLPGAFRRGRPAAGWLSRLTRRRPRLRALKFWHGRAVCPACVAGREAEARYLLTVLDFIGDFQFERAFDKSSGLCLPHTLRLAELGAARPGLGTVLERIATKWERLRGELKTFVAKHDYRATEPFTDEEARSWTLALELLAGAPGVFGNDLHSERAAGPSPAPAESSGAPAPISELEALQFEKEKLELRVKELTDQLSEVSSRAAALHYRLWQVLEDRKALTMNLSGEQAASRLLEQTVEELRKEVDRLTGPAKAGPGRRGE